MNHNENTYNILIIRFSSIGDIILSSPLLRSIKEKYPNVKIDYLTLSENSILLKYNPYIDRLLLIDKEKGFSDIVNKSIILRKIKYHYIIDLHRNLRSLIFKLFLKYQKKTKLNKHYIKRFLLVHTNINLYCSPYSVINRYYDAAKVLNIQSEKNTEIWTNHEDLIKSIETIKSISNLNISPITGHFIGSKQIQQGLINKYKQKIISIMPFAKWKTKEWGDSKFIELGCRLTEEETYVFILGGSEDKKRCEEISRCIGKNAIALAGRLTLLETATALSISDCLVTNDTGVMHLGGAISIPVLAIFGCTTEELGFFPNERSAKVIQIPVKCRPCTAKGRLECPKKHFRCMKDITVDTIYSSLKQMLKSN
ncbi:MAG: glycosyltransferase family 9 protein [Spirochaetota bacterium]|nr:glycosyltransferase family 9 protein [Spirochaetota bacterium]